MVQFLLQLRTGMINVVDESGDTALHLGSRVGHDGVIEVLLSYDDCVVSHKNAAGCTPLHDAIWGKHMACILQLLSHPAIDVAVRDDEGRTALHCAVQVTPFPSFRLLFSLFSRLPPLPHFLRASLIR